MTFWSAMVCICDGVGVEEIARVLEPMTNLPDAASLMRVPNRGLPPSLGLMLVPARTIEVGLAVKL